MALQARLSATDTRQLLEAGRLPGLEVVDKVKRASYQFAFGQEVPDFYLDLPFTCRDCGSKEIWTAKQQKWWYEVAQGSIYSRAIRCRACRQARHALVNAAGVHQGADRLREEVTRLRALAASQPDAAALAQVDAALQSKWRSLRVVAIEVLGRWGGRKQIKQLEAFAEGHLGEADHREWEWDAAFAAAKALALHAKKIKK